MLAGLALVLLTQCDPFTADGPILSSPARMRHGGFPDAGFPGTRGFGIGTFGWGPECSGLTPVPGMEYLKFGGNPGHLGNTGYVNGTFTDRSNTCCKSNGDCVELWGDDPALGINLAEANASKTNAADGLHYGVAIEPLAIKNYLHNTRDVSVGWDTTGPVVAANTYPGPFGYWLNGPGGNAMAQVTVVADGGPQSICQTVDAGTGMYPFSGWLKAGTIGTVRMSLTGTGNSAGNATCTRVLGDAGQGRREACTTPAQYTSALTAIKVCITAGAADNVSGTFGMSDLQLERDPSDFALANDFAFPTMYTANVGDAGTTITRSAVSFGVDAPAFSEVNGDSGCAGVGVSQRLYDPAVPYSAYGTWLNPSSGPYSLLQLGSDVSNYRSNDHNGHSFVTAYTDIISQGDGGEWYIEAEWDGGAGGSICHWTPTNSLTCSSSDIVVLDPDYQGFSFGANGAITGVHGGIQYGPVIWGQGAQCRSEPAITNRGGHMIYAIGDGWSGGGFHEDDRLYPTWFGATTVRQVASTHGYGVQSANRWLYEDGGQCCSDYPSRKQKYPGGDADSEAVWLGDWDIKLGAGGDKTFGSALYYMQQEARKFYPGGTVYWFNLPPTENTFKTEKDKFNQHWSDFCSDGGFVGFSSYMRPEPGLVCIDAASVLAPDGGDFTLPAYLNSGTGFLTQVGANAVGAKFRTMFP